MIMAPDVREIVPPAQRGDAPRSRAGDGPPSRRRHCGTPDPGADGGHPGGPASPRSAPQRPPGRRPALRRQGEPVDRGARDPRLPQGARWDVASPGEIDAVLDVDPDPRHLSYGNTVKKAADIAYATARRRAPVLLRQRRRSSTSSPATHPGATLMVRLATSGQRRRLGARPEVRLQRARGRPAAWPAPPSLGHPVGVCFHVGSQQHDVHAWDAPLAATARLRSSIRRFGTDIAVVDLGGGFPGTRGGCRPRTSTTSAWASSAPCAGTSDRPRPRSWPSRAASWSPTPASSRPRWSWSPSGTACAGCTSTSASSPGSRRRWARRCATASPRTATAGPRPDPSRRPCSPARPATASTCSTSGTARRCRPTCAPGTGLRLHGTGAYTTTYSSVGFNGFAPLRELTR